jgi:SAM-dependent methyltransferase
MTRGRAYGNQVADGRASDPATACYPIAADAARAPKQADTLGENHSESEGMERFHVIVHVEDQIMSTGAKSEIYDREFFDRRDAAALQSARVVAPLVYDLLRPRSVVDVGCGRGAWLKAFEECGVEHVQGFDGDYETLLIGRQGFTPYDLSRMKKIEGHFDLAVCLEVLEHLSPESGRNVVDALTGAASVILFSAAIPGQGGTGHVNEQWPSYWRELFERRGYIFLDPLRRKIRDDQRVNFWYRQNLLMFASEEAVAANQLLKAEAAHESQADIEWIHISMVRKDRSVKAMLRAISHVLPSRLRKRLKRSIAS